MGKGNIDEAAIANVQVRNYGSGWRNGLGVGLERHVDGKSGQLGVGLDVGSDRQHNLFKEEAPKKVTLGF